MTITKKTTNRAKTMGGKLFVEGKISNTHYDPRWFDLYKTEESKTLLKIGASFSESDLDKYLKILAMTPEGPLRKVIKTFYNKTPVALELPYFSFLFFLSVWLSEKGATVMIGRKKVIPFVWFLLLATSGGFKTFSNNRIKGNAPINEDSIIQGFKSDAKLFEMLHNNETKGNKNVIIVDEFAQVLKSIETAGSPLTGVKEIFLLAYDGEKIERNTKKEELVINNPTFNFLGINVYDTFLQSLSHESMNDGFFQRFSPVVASDPKQEEIPRNARAGKYTEIDTEILDITIKEAWDEITSQEVLETYKLSPEAKKIFEAASDEFDSKYQCVGDSFFIRERYRMFTNALIFHFLRGKGSEELLDTTDAEYAVLLFEKSLESLAKIIRDKNPDKVFNKVDRIREARYKYEAKQKANADDESKIKKFTVRDAIAAFAGKVKADEVKALWEIAFNETP